MFYAIELPENGCGIYPEAYCGRGIDYVLDEDFPKYEAGWSSDEDDAIDDLLWNKGARAMNVIDITFPLEMTILVLETNDDRKVVAGHVRTEPIFTEYTLGVAWGNFHEGVQFTF